MFNEIYDEDLILISRTQYWRIQDKHYGVNSMKALCAGILFYLENYNKPYKLGVAYKGTKIFYEICDEKDNTFAIYEYKRGKVMLDKIDTDLYLDYLKRLNDYNAETHFFT